MGVSHDSATLVKANARRQARAAVILWQQFVDSAPADSPDLAARKQNWTKWKTLADGNAEKIKGRWIGGEERRSLVDKSRKLYKESEDCSANVRRSRRLRS